MDNLYTDAMLKKLNKEELSKIAADNEIEIPEGATNPKLIELILEKGCKIPADNPEPDPEANPVEEFVEDGKAPKYSKQQILESSWYSHRRGVLENLLEDNETYSYAKVEWLIAKNA